MEPALIAPAHYTVLGIPTLLFSLLIPLVGVGVFAFIMNRRVAPLLKAAPDSRFDDIAGRLANVVKIWLGQWRQPRYMTAGVLHILIFFGFLALAVHTTSLVFVGIFAGFSIPGLGGGFGHLYMIVKDYAATVVLLACIVAAVRRGILRPERYAVPAKYGQDHTAEAVFVLALISLLMITDSLFEASSVAAQVQLGQQGEYLAPGTLAWLLKNLLLDTPRETLQTLHIAGYYIHDLTFFFFLCFLPMGKHFHVITSLFNVYFMRTEKGNVKPVRYGISDEQLDDLDTFGVKKLEDFTWKHLLDFYTCADCGRCSDQCPARTVGRPLSPRFISIKGRDLLFRNYPLRGEAPAAEALIGTVYEEDEIWSCTTCGACEEECPIGIEYIDKIVDLRRGMVDEGMVPQSLQKPLKAMEKRGNPWGKMEKKRGDWAAAAGCEVKVVADGDSAEVLYFVDSFTSYDDRMQGIAQATARVLTAAGVDFAILGKEEKDSGHEVRRFGEEMLFQDLKKHNSEMIGEAAVQAIVTADPHAFNALRHDYPGLPKVEHISQLVVRMVRAGRLSLLPIDDPDKVYTYHDPCYLGRHNGIYDDPREAMDALEGIKRVEMEKSRDRSFCCGGGGLMLFYEPEEEERMAVLRVKMAAEAGATVIVVACPFCLANMEDAIKVAGLEGKMEAVDLVELIDRHLAPQP